MSNLIKELEIALDSLIDEKEDHYSDRKQAEKWITQDFARWLVNRFSKEIK